MNHGPFTAEETRHNVQTAHEALGCGDLMHALFHISSALATDPTNREWLTVLHEVMRRAADPLAIVRLDEAKSDFISAATRAYVLAAKGRLAEALPLLAEVAEVRPDVGYLVWAEQWLAQPGAARSLSLDVACGRVLAPLLKMVSRAPSPMAKDDPRLPTCATRAPSSPRSAAGSRGTGTWRGRRKPLCLARRRVYPARSQSEVDR